MILLQELIKLKENDFDTAQAGGSGALTYAPTWGTFASPDVVQNPDAFYNSNNNKAIGPHSNLATGAPAAPQALDQQVDQIYSKKSTPTPDEVMTGLKYELQHMIKKDKGRAKQLVIGNLQQDPHYYGKLGMLNINDKEMMKVQPPTAIGSATTPVNETINETKKILDQMLAARTKKDETPQSYKDALKDTRERKNARYLDR